MNKAASIHPTTIRPPVAAGSEQTPTTGGVNSRLQESGTRSSLRLACTLAGVVLLAACGDKEPATATTPEAAGPKATTAVLEQTSSSASKPVELTPTEVFWNSLKTLCNKQFGGQLTIGTEESDRDIGYAELIMDARRCTANEIDIGFSVDEDDSRTWMIRRLESGLSLHHQHLDTNGKPDATSGYGGYTDTTTQGTALRQEFPADEQTGQLIPAAATNVWAVEVVPDKMFAYELQRVEEQRMFRVVFDLSNPLD